MSVFVGFILLALAMCLTYYTAAIGAAYQIHKDLGEIELKDFSTVLITIAAIVVPLITVLASYFLFK